MTEDEKDRVAGARNAQAAAKAEERRLRAAETLRENLLRRKTQARARRSGAADEAVGVPAAKKDEAP
ncbi:hypothetical protein [Rhizobium halophilum]|uniref:hypothetical protein n=1 Tax=Rhizobium halophilum TaxID=2846852 RepID=UPI001EFDCD45|nr:hypothetical protein [Rhizobium halophilum]MCF6369507.1 hypothetical protein [Rhizobium halophilum]